MLVPLIFSAALAAAALVAALPDVLPDFAALPPDAAVVAVGVPAAPPPTVTTWTGAAAREGGAFWPDRPMRTPTPIASSSVPTPAMSAVLTPKREKREPCETTRSARTAAGCATGSRDCPRRWPHWTQ